MVVVERVVHAHKCGLGIDLEWVGGVMKLPVGKEAGDINIREDTKSVTFKTTSTPLPHCVARERLIGLPRRQLWLHL